MNESANNDIVILNATNLPSTLASILPLTIQQYTTYEQGIRVVAVHCLMTKN